MLNNNVEYNELLLEAWEKFINNEEHDYSFMRPEILESWKRSRSYLVDPYHPKKVILPPKDLEKRIQDNRFFIEVTKPYMEKLYSVVKGSGYYLLLIDKDGYIIDLIGDPEAIEHGKEHSMLVVGSNRSEQYAGTNAIGTGLVLKKPIQMWGGEHYVKPHKQYSCSSAPILDPEGNIIGALNITGSSTDYHTHTLGMIISAVDGISNELKRINAYKEIERVSNQRNLIIETMPPGLIFLNKENEITQLNSKAVKMFNLKNKDVIGKSLFDFILFEDMKTVLDKEIYNKEKNVFLVESPSNPSKYNVSIDFVYDKNGVRDGTVIRFNETRRINRLVNTIGGYKANYTISSIIGSSPATMNMIRDTEKAAKSSSNILILGESGTGKELIAQAIHNGSRYSSGPFVAINCGALPKGLVESELFGYERGAFTGAHKDGHPGKFELADGGTLFLDEIGEMPLDVQVSLLRVLETREVVRIGGKYAKPIDIRIVAATNADLLKAVENRTFRNDLFYRLNVFAIHVPPLRKRGEDVYELTEYFLQRFRDSKKINFTVDPEVYKVFMKYSWPGNIRELENTIERAINITEGSEIRVEHLPNHILDAVSSAQPEEKDEEEEQTSKLDIESSNYRLIVSSLQQSGGNIKRAAEILGISRRTLYRKMDKFNIDLNEFRN